MPGHRQPRSLEGLSLGRVCRLLDGTCRRLQVLSQESSAAQILAYAKQTIRPYYIDALPASLRSQVIEETSRMLYGPSSDGSTLISGPAPLYLLALLLGHDIKQLKVNLCCYYGCSHQTSLLKLLATEGSGLESLELARSALLRLDCKLLRSALLNMKNLRSLTLRNIASDAILQVIGRSCPKLVILDVACSRQVTDAGVKQLLLQVELRDKVMHAQVQEATSWSRLKTLLSKLRLRNSKADRKDRQGVLLEYYESKNFLCDTLRVLNVANTGVTSAGVVLALVHVPRLESLADYCHMGRVVEIMNKGLEGFMTPFSLTQARSCRTTPARLRLLARACPRVEKLHISEPYHPPEALQMFPYVTSLSVHNIPADRDWFEGFYDYLYSHGRNLRELNLRIAHSENPLQVDLREIFTSCPNLKTLSHDESNVLWSDGYEPPVLKYLKKVQLGRTVEAVAIMKVISLAPELKALHVHSCFDLTDEQLEKLLNPPARSWSTWRSDNKYDNSLVQNLTCFYIYEASRVSATTVLSMFKNCKKLRKIGNLANWGLDCEGVRMLRTTLARTNLDVELCPGSHWFWSNCIH